MIAQRLYHYTANRPCRLIKLAGKPYMERYFLFESLGIFAYLHRFVGTDGERHLHDHPWPWAQSIVLTGGYTEERGEIAALPNGRDVWTYPPALTRVRLLNRLTRDMASTCERVTVHRIASTEPETWTLFMHPGWTRDWGFYTPGLLGTHALYQSYADAPANQNEKRWWKAPGCPIGATAGREPFGGTQ